MKNNKSQHINNKTGIENNTNEKDDNGEMNLNTNNEDIFSIQALELQLGG